MTIMEAPVPTATQEASPAAAAQADWTLAQLMAHIDASRAELGAAGSMAAYETWLARHPEPEAFAARFNLACLRQGAGRAAQAEADYRRLLEEHELPEARYNLGLLLEQGGRAQEACEQWRVLATAPAAQTRPALQQQAAHAWLQRARREGPPSDLAQALLAQLALDPTLADHRAEWALRQPLAALPPADQGPAPVVCVITVCFNEAPMLPFFLDHCVHHLGASRIVLHDGGSTDGSAEIAARYPQAEFIVSRMEKTDDRELMRIRNEEWKKYRDGCDWMIVCDVDEFLYHPRMRETLQGLKRQGVTLPMVEGYNIVSKALPPHRPGRLLWQDCQTGIADPRYGNKNLIFDPQAVEINYLLGCHSCQPTGTVKRSAGMVFKSLHMCMPSYAHVIAKSRRMEARTSDWNRQVNAGFHYKLNLEMTRAQYNAKFLAADNVFEPRPRPAGAHPALECVMAELLARDLDARILQIGAAAAFDARGDNGAVASFAWYVHHAGGRFAVVDADERRLRHLRHELQRQGQWSERVSLSTTVAAACEADEPGTLDLLYLDGGDHLGDEADRQCGQRQALMQFVELQPRLGAQALVVLEEPGRAPGAPADAGGFALLRALLQGLGCGAEDLGELTLLRPGR